MEPVRKIFKDFALAFYKTAKKDLERAKNALDQDDWAESVYWSQQCAEKIAKAVLELEEVIVSDHDVATPFLKHVVEKNKETQKVYEYLDWFETGKKWILPRYPVRRMGKVIVPEEQFKRKDAQEALEKAEFVFNTLKNFLKEKYGFDFEKSTFKPKKR